MGGRCRHAHLVGATAAQRQHAGVRRQSTKVLGTRPGRENPDRAVTFRRHSVARAAPLARKAASGINVLLTPFLIGLYAPSSSVWGTGDRGAGARRNRNG